MFLRDIHTPDNKGPGHTALPPHRIQLDPQLCQQLLPLVAFSPFPCGASTGGGGGPGQQRLQLLPCI